MEDRVVINVWANRGNDGETLDLYFSNLEDAYSFSRYWATVEGEEITEERSCRFKVIPNYTGGSHPHTLNDCPKREVVEAWMALFEEDSESD